jgi:8-oxo-dGTP diphosphatase
MEYTKHYIGACAVVMREGKILLGKRKGGAGAGSWGLPGGHLDAGEMLADCAVRELMEETGMVGTRPTFLCVKNSYQENVKCNYVTFAFVVEAAGEPNICEPDFCDEWGWFAFDALPEPVTSFHVELLHLIKAGEVFRDERAV